MVYIDYVLKLVSGQCLVHGVLCIASSVPFIQAYDLADLELQVRVLGEFLITCS